MLPKFYKNIYIYWVIYTNGIYDHVSFLLVWIYIFLALYVYEYRWEHVSVGLIKLTKSFRLFFMSSSHLKHVHNYKPISHTQQGICITHPCTHFFLLYCVYVWKSSYACTHHLTSFALSKPPQKIFIAHWSMIHFPSILSSLPVLLITDLCLKHQILFRLF